MTVVNNAVNMGVQMPLPVPAFNSLGINPEKELSHVGGALMRASPQAGPLQKATKILPNSSFSVFSNMRAITSPTVIV